MTPAHAILLLLLLLSTVADAATVASRALLTTREGGLDLAEAELPDPHYNFEYLNRQTDASDVRGLVAAFTASLNRIHKTATCSEVVDECAFALSLPSCGFCAVASEHYLDLASCQAKPPIAAAYCGQELEASRVLGGDAAAAMTQPQVGAAVGSAVASKPAAAGGIAVGAGMTGAAGESTPEKATFG